MSQKQRVEPEVSVPDGEDMPEPNEVTLEDLVPGLEEEIARQEGDESAAGDAEPVDEIDETVALIAALQAERDDYKDKWTRSLAEAENVRRRAERDKKDAQTYGGTKLARDLLSVHDNLDRALALADETIREQAAGFVEGIDLTRNELLNAFAKHQIQKVEPEKGEKFDPNRHQAMFEAPVPGATPGTIIEVMQAGFVIADRLLRPALVGVAKAAPEAAPDPVAGSQPDADGPKEASGD
ncbi:MAG: nucleotide exchange factor GrpE [Pseudomonadota bacterium]